MSVQITIIGLGQVGSSIGLALAEQKSIKRVGHDKIMKPLAPRKKQARWMRPKSTFQPL